MDTQDDGAVVRLIKSDASWIEGEAIRQLETTAKLDGMVAAVGMPDLHPGKGHPVGAAFVSRGKIYPDLVGNDIGCGMALWQTDIAVRKIKLDKFVKKIDGLDEPWEGDVAERIDAAGLPEDLASPSLGTIGGGNHFAELQRIDEIFDQEAFAPLKIDPEHALVLVHSGSRGLGEAISAQPMSTHMAHAAWKPDSCVRELTSTPMTTRGMGRCQPSGDHRTFSGLPGRRC